MPLYEYGCKDCGHRFDVQQKLADAPLVKCPECSHDTLEKIISAANFVFKGGGWAKDGYGQDPKKKPRTDNQRIDRLTKAIDEDKVKTAKKEAAAATSTTPSTSGGDKT